MSVDGATNDGARSSGAVLPVRVGVLDSRESALDVATIWGAEHAQEFEVVVRASTWVDLVRSENFPTALVLMDDQVVGGVSVEARIRTCRAAGAIVIVMSSYDFDEAKTRALAAGAAAFLSKSDSADAFRDAARLAMGLTGRGATAADAAPGPGAEIIRPKLSRGELTALRLYADGITTAAVARSMNVKYETAKTYLRRVREKYAKANRPASRRAELITRATEDGYLQ